MKNDNFYIGYLPQAPEGLRRHLRRTVLLLAVLGVGLAAVLLLAQAPFPAAVFEYGEYKQWEGTLVRAGSVPALLTGASRKPVLLVAPGKHGFTDGTPGEHVRLEGARIQRDGLTMLEVLPQSLRSTGTGAELPITDAAQAMLTGEIVDSKCYLGVMNPGKGKVHRDCAVRCISGGVPPLLLAGDGRQVILLHAGNIRDFIAVPVRVEGSLARWGELWVMDGIRISYK